MHTLSVVLMFQKVFFNHKWHLLYWIFCFFCCLQRFVVCSTSESRP